MRKTQFLHRLGLKHVFQTCLEKHSVVFRCHPGDREVSTPKEGILGGFHQGQRSGAGREAAWSSSASLEPGPGGGRLASLSPATHSALPLEDRGENVGRPWRGRRTPRRRGRWAAEAVSLGTGCRGRRRALAPTLAQVPRTVFLETTVRLCFPHSWEPHCLGGRFGRVQGAGMTLSMCFPLTRFRLQ